MTGLLAHAADCPRNAPHEGACTCWPERDRRLAGGFLVLREAAQRVIAHPRKCGGAYCGDPDCDTIADLRAVLARVTDGEQP